MSLELRKLLTSLRLLRMLLERLMPVRIGKEILGPELERLWELLILEKLISYSEKRMDLNKASLRKISHPRIKVELKMLLMTPCSFNRLISY